MGAYFTSNFTMYHITKKSLLYTGMMVYAIIYIYMLH